MKYPNLLDLWSRYANAEVGASNSQVNSGTVLFVFRASRFIRRCLKQQAAIRSYSASTGRYPPSADI
ncbi:MAG: hypothetical protein F6K50_05820 [Moorea sp. SIO3I7]|uniref:hypothetical protein n=1 Tax=unclassified Moorena TaxID=2683338 RepID=UPI0013BFA0A1|nr:MULTISPECIES: hypothetical protein [unclassified Moorena]NEN95062.1 hypothetical protein [Moorena sp. SIO3I7]NEO63528.1 hypothetical protein [Moorena sp. SIO4G2]NEO05292.1 hypothetical protein [Moorena sp. SIO3I8]NEO19197.1 hypothetical protein [Moorena sp. SIO4A5]NEP21550.1 hypothetical protein [Moorena sp. SIO3I6]